MATKSATMAVRALLIASLAVGLLGCADSGLGLTEQQIPLAQQPSRPPINQAPHCNWAAEAPDGFSAGKSIFFYSTSNDPDGTLIRYAWTWGDETRGDAPEEVHVFHSAGTFTVTHAVTDNVGAQTSCSADLTIRQ